MLLELGAPCEVLRTVEYTFLPSRHDAVGRLGLQPRDQSKPESHRRRMRHVLESAVHIAEHDVGWADLDHVIEHSCGGPTSCTNLCCLCRTDHRVKTFARGWRFVMEADGTLHVTTPSGVTRTTRPPGLRPPEPEPPPPEPDDDPPPF